MTDLLLKGMALGLAAALMLAACGGGAEPRPAADQRPASVADGSASPEAPAGAATSPHGEMATTAPAKLRPLRQGERRLSLAMPEPHVPSAPTGVGTDDYRCFLLDPGLQRDVFVTGTDVVPGNAAMVHHVILFQVPPEQVEQAEGRDAAEEGAGWTCFGGPGVGSGPALDDAPWLGAWAPGGRESVFRAGYGVPLAAGSRIIMQVHYSLLAGSGPDVSATRLRLAGGASGLTPVSTMLLPAPVELPCRRGHREAPLCDREAALADVKARFGAGPGSTADLLHLLCRDEVRPGPVQSCTRTIGRPTTIVGAAGHMHLLGRSIRIEVNPGTPTARTVLDIPVWNFDDQRARRVGPVALQPFDTVRVTCRHTQRLRDVLPAFEGQPDRYVLWGEGTTDEMCLGILQVTRP